MKTGYAVFENSSRLIALFGNRADAEEMVLSLFEELSYFLYLVDAEMGFTIQEHFNGKRKAYASKKKKYSFETYVLLSGAIVASYTIREKVLFE